jgi:hypothetical protein
MGGYEHFIITVLSSTAVSVAVTAALVFIGRTWLYERLRQSIEHEYSIRFESFRHDLQSRQELAVQQIRHDAEKEIAARSVAADAFQAAHVAAYHSRLDAIKSMWEAIISLRQNAPGFLIFADILTADEESRMLADPERRREIEKYSTGDAQQFCTTVSLPVEHRRPFLGERLYAMFYAYRAFLLRVPWAYNDSVSRGKPRPWREDPAARDILRAALPAEEVDRVLKPEIGMMMLAQQFFEQGILREIATVISGGASANTAVDTLREIDAAMMRK